MCIRDSFGGLVRTVENGKVHEAVKLEYRDGDVLLVNVHALHRISRYKDKDSDTPPRVYKLGSGAWQRMKNATKSAVKDIARELIKLYAERKESGGFAFSPDGYLQHELEASFPYEETPDQQQAVELVKHDMEQAQPMDCLLYTSMSPCLKIGIGMGYVKPEFSKAGNNVYIKVREKLLKAEVVKLPFV